MAIKQNRNNKIEKNISHIKIYFFFFQENTLSSRRKKISIFPKKSEILTKKSAVKHHFLRQKHRLNYLTIHTLNDIILSRIRRVFLQEEMMLWKQFKQQLPIA